MSIQLVSISHKTAPMHIRSLVAFDEGQQLKLMEAIKTHAAVAECVVIATCNRTEIYTYTSAAGGEREIFEWVQQCLVWAAKTDEDFSRVLRFYYGEKAERHLFEVSCGLDSMVIGEDQILGQVKQAHKQAMENHMCGTYLNTFFRYAVTAAKRVKTDTKLSKTPVSTASVCIKAARDYVGTLSDKKVMVIGATGKIGGIVVKNLMADYKPKLYLTMRNVKETKTVTDSHGGCTYTEIPYDERCQYLDEMDVVISATASPHYTLTYESVKKHLKSEKKRAFMDLAVPPDIERRIGQLSQARCFNIDDFSKTAKENNEKKLQEAGEAMEILEKYETDFKKWMLFQQALEDIRRVKEATIKDYEEKGIDRAMNKLFFKIREHADTKTLEGFLDCLSKM